VLALLLVALSLSMSNFAASIAIGLSGVDAALRVRIALAFGLFEAGMPVVGLVIGRQLTGTLGGDAHLIGGGLLAAAGLYTVIEALRPDDQEPGLDTLGTGRLLLLAAGLSVDNLVVGFALGADNASLVLAVALITTSSVGLSLVGLELGARLGGRVEQFSELLGGVVLIAVGAAIAVRPF
jgi:putative Mn2+ efflux pump MntP